MEQQWNADHYAAHGRFVAELADPVLELLDPKPGERVLDVGCGDGPLTAKITARGAKVVGIDTSPEMVMAAQKIGVDARVMAAEHLDFTNEFDAVFSNAALHWIREQDLVFAGIRRSLKRGGRFVAEVGGHGNIAAIRVALAAVLKVRGVAAEETNHFFTPEEYRERLVRNGFRVETIELLPRPTALKTGMRAWLETFRRGVLEQLPESIRENVLDETVALLAPVLRDEAGNWTADYVRLRFKAWVE